MKTIIDLTSDLCMFDQAKATWEVAIQFPDRRSTSLTACDKHLGKCVASIIREGDTKTLLVKRRIKEKVKKRLANTLGADIQIDDVLTTSDGMFMVRDVDDSDKNLIRLLLAAGRTDDGEWVTVQAVKEYDIYRNTKEDQL